MVKIPYFQNESADFVEKQNESRDVFHYIRESQRNLWKMEKPVRKEFWQSRVEEILAEQSRTE